MRRPGLRPTLATALFAVAIWQLGSAGWIAAKAELAQILLDRAWEQSEGGQRTVRPWPWADTQPVARLRIGDDGQSLMVLDGASGRNLAFGPAHLMRTPWPAQGGSTLIAGHRDTHFRALKTVSVNDEIRLERAGTVHRYQVSDIGVVHQDGASELENLAGDNLVLVTCYPFDAIDPGTPWRYVVRARLVIEG